ncbi:hypothetical protein JMJ35_002273 [Cladonia borealis]|uniref:Fe2OG dioxygenase domain-containing protein n=1 Tax=Cladonia borealis TaxID=184061 RepID=A0AA39R737_9LECA|nr:hypothetical protein JMJ35_002273 [Cladonia borealis]
MSSPTFPTIDISPFLNPHTPTPLLLSTATSLSRACSSPGFFYLTNHNIPPELCNRILNLTRTFFLHAPASQKQTLLRRDVGIGNGDGARGYQVIGDNVTEGKRDWHEAVDFYRPVREGEPFSSPLFPSGDDLEGDDGEKDGEEKKRGLKRERAPPYELLMGMNQWPSGWRDTFEIYVREMLVLGEAVVRAMGVALGGGMEGEGRFVGVTGKSWWVMRAIGYPSLKEKGEEGGVSCGAHSDYGCVTLLLSDGTRGALQAWVGDDEGSEKGGEGGGSEDGDGNKGDKGGNEKGGRWVDVDPVEGALVVNIGDMMARWSGGKWKATRHRVVHRGEGFRVSVPFFFEPDWDARVPGGRGEGEVVYGEYLSGKVRGNF